MKDKVKDVFEAASYSTFEVLAQSGVAYQVPDYQRSYSWKEKNIYRLFEDICHGIEGLKKESTTLSFFGAIIVTRVDSSPDMPSTVLSIVDGQQRLTTIILILTILHENIRTKTHELTSKLNNKPFTDEIKKTLQTLKKCIFDDHAMSDDVYDLQPIITRYTDTWGNEKHDCSYRSAVSFLLHEYAKHIYEKKTETFTFKLVGNNDDNEKIELNSRLAYIQSLIDKMISDEAEENYLHIENILSLSFSKNIQEQLYKYHEEMVGLESSFANLQSEEYKEVLLSILLGKYITEKVVLTKVVTSEKYAFEVFESLNATGEPLTAIETFKPKLIGVVNALENHKEGFNSSSTKAYFSTVEVYIGNKGEEEKQAITQNLLISFGLLYSGETIGKNLSVQRKYLRDQVEKLKSEQEISEFIFHLKELVLFRKEIWETSELNNSLNGCPDRNVVLTSIEFLRSANKTLTVPILTRYYIAAKQSGDFSTFSKITKAISAFTLIWRAAFSGTNRIDHVYREIMSHGYKKKKSIKVSEVNKPLSFNHSSLPTIEEFCDVLRAHLEAKKIGNFDEWFKYTKKSNIYKASGPIAKMFLLLANNKTQWNENKEILERIARSNVNEFMTLDVWYSKRSATIEHTAPQNVNSTSTWDPAIYDDLDTINTIGNLTLLPKKENANVANKNWDQKKAYFNCFTQRCETTLSDAITAASKIGLNIPEKVKKELLVSDYLDFLTPLVKEKSWDLKVIEKRTKNLSELMWTEADSWLSLK